MSVVPFILALVYRSLFLAFPQTFFQPDEFWQSLEPAHHQVFGYGYLTWEWRDLPDGGRLRGWLWPSCFVGVYRLLQWLGLDETGLLTLGPRIVGVCVAALTDWATYRLSAKLMGPGSAAAAFFLSITSLFHAYALPRSFSNSPETMLTAWALVYFPFRAAGSPSAIVVGDQGLVVSKSMRDVSEVKTRGQSTREEKQGVIRLDDAADINYAVMDRLGPDVADQESPKDSLALSLFFAATAICIRTTTAPLWLYLGLDHWIQALRTKGLYASVHTACVAVVIGSSVLAASTAIDYYFTGKLYFPLWTFFLQNVLNDISSFYGKTNPLYHLTQSLPILLFPTWYWWLKGFLACLLPQRLLPGALSGVDRPPGMRTLARATTFAVALLSLSPHSEWRFVHPFLPPLLLFALPPLFQSYTPTIIGAYRFTDSLRQYTRLPKRAFYLLLVAPVVPCIYLNVFHGRAQVKIMEVLRSGQVGEVTSLAAVMVAHHVPWYSHLHKDVPAWFLTGEPPLDLDPTTYRRESEHFYDAPLSYIEDLLTDAKLPGWSWTGHSHPSHVIAFGSMLKETGLFRGSEQSMSDAMTELGYKPVWSMWNGFDLPFEHEARGGLHIWTRSDAAIPTEPRSRARQDL